MSNCWQVWLSDSSGKNPHWTLLAILSHSQGHCSDLPYFANTWNRPRSRDRVECRYWPLAAFKVKNGLESSPVPVTESVVWYRSACILAFDHLLNCLACHCSVLALSVVEHTNFQSYSQLFFYYRGKNFRVLISKRLSWTTTSTQFEIWYHYQILNYPHCARESFSNQQTAFL